MDSQTQLMDIGSFNDSDCSSLYEETFNSPLRGASLSESDEEEFDLAAKAFDLSLDIHSCGQDLSLHQPEGSESLKQCPVCCSDPLVPSMMNAAPVLTIWDFDALEKKGYLCPIGNDMISISRNRALSDSYTFEHLSDPRDGEEYDQLVDMPIFFNSLATLRYLGFSEKRASEIFERWENNSHLPLNEIIDSAYHLVLDYAQHYNVTNNWIKALEYGGIDAQLIYEIMSPSNDCFREDKRVFSWLYDFFEDRIKFLEVVFANSLIRTCLLRRDPSQLQDWDAIRDTIWNYIDKEHRGYFDMDFDEMLDYAPTGKEPEEELGVMQLLYVQKIVPRLTMLARALQPS